MSTHRSWTARALMSSLMCIAAPQLALAQCDGEWLVGDPYAGADDNVTIVTT